jgi:hypothetical protein
MCTLCQEWQKGNITNKEAFRALGEMLETATDELQKEHLWDLSERILDKDIPTTAPDEQTEEEWWISSHRDEE